MHNIFTKLFSGASISGMYNANRKLEKKINVLLSTGTEFGIYSNYIDLTEEQMMDFYNQSLKNKNSIEDKSKASLIAITLSISLVVGLISVILKLNDSSSVSMVFKIMIALLSLIVVFYMAVAGVLSLYCLGQINSVYLLRPEDMVLNGDDKKKEIAICTECNDRTNTMRNNYMYASYRSIIIALIILLVLFMSIVIDTYFCEQIKEDENIIIEREIISRLDRGLDLYEDNLEFVIKSNTKTQEISNFDIDSNDIKILIEQNENIMKKLNDLELYLKSDYMKSMK